MGRLMALGLVADRYQVEAVQGAVEEAVMGLLTVERCGGVLAWSNGSFGKGGSGCGAGRRSSRSGR